MLLETKNENNNVIYQRDNNMNTIKPKKDKERKNYKFQDYFDFENGKLIMSYGTQVYEYSRYLEGLTFDLRDSEVRLIEILSKHEISSNIRTKLVDWIFEVLYAYKCDENTMFLTFHIMDAYIYKTKTVLTNSDLHLIGMTSLYIASKFEDLYPLDLATVKTRIAHGKYSEKELKRKEKEILDTIDFKIIGASTYEFIKNFLYDFSYNNKKTIKQLNFKTEIRFLEETAVFVAKIIMHSDLFSGFKSSIKAISCIILAFDIVRANVPSFKGEIEKFTNEWIKFVVEQSRYEPDHIVQLYTKIKEYYETFDSTPLIQHNLKKNVSLPY